MNKDVIELARELGKAIQQDERYIIFRQAEEENDNDAELQVMIKDFNELRGEIQIELSKSEKDQERFDELDKRYKDLYNSIINRPDMLVYNEAKSKLDKVLSYVNQIIVGSVQGQDPDEIEEPIQCTGSCGTCGGCH